MLFRSGSDPAKRGEFILYNAHWDHLGKDERLKGDQIFNGAADNAAGTAVLLEIARTLAAGPAPRRSVTLQPMRGSSSVGSIAFMRVGSFHAPANASGSPGSS